MVEVTIGEKLSTNKIYRMHHIPKAAFQNMINHDTKICCMEQKVQPIEETVHDFTYEFFLLGKSLDTLNTAGMAKAIEDALRYCGVLKDDSKKYVDRVSLVERKSQKSYNYCVVTWQKKQ